MKVNEAAELISLALTSPTMISAGVVIALWHKAAWRALWSRERSAYQWLILGVSASFVGGFLDNAWWGIAWGHEFLGSTAAAWWFTHGVFANIPFRQLAGIAAGFCHVRSAMMGTEGRNFRLRLFNFVLLVATVLSLVLWTALHWASVGAWIGL